MAARNGGVSVGLDKITNNLNKPTPVYLYRPQKPSTVPNDPTTVVPSNQFPFAGLPFFF